MIDDYYHRALKILDMISEQCSRDIPRLQVS